MGEFDDIEDENARRDASSSETARQSSSSDASSVPGPSSPGSAADPVADPTAGPAADSDNRPAVDPAAGPAAPAREWRVRARRELTEKLILEEVGGIEGKNAGRVLALHSLM